jgi:hypothetical protein
MNHIFANTRLALLCLFIVASVGSIAYQAWFIWPMQKCERAGDWWSPEHHQCATPIPVWRITGRMPGQPRAAPVPTPTGTPPTDPR